MERQFVQQYPNAHLDRFKFNVILSKTGDVTGTKVSFKVRDGQFLDITTDDFKTLYSGELHWLLRIWDTSGTVQPLVTSSSSSLPYNYRKFTIYVNANSGFTSNFDALSTLWKGNANDITKIAVDKDDPYFAWLLAAYIISHVGGMSRKHLTGDNNVVTSIARYCIYYHMKRFTGTPEKMSPYITNDIKKMIQKNIPHKRIWAHKFERMRADINYWHSHHANKNNIRNYRYRMSANNTGVLGIEYEVSKVVNDSDNDWMKFIKDDSDGLTKTGQILLQSAIESYVYSVLGTQAQTRWPIVGQGAKSLQTQQIFHRLVQDTVAQDNPSKAISDMRKAIQDTNVVLNMAITPGIILIPSNMIILKNKVEGYNNVLTIATNAMKFGVNTKVNYVAPKVTKKPPIPPTTKPPTPTVKPNSGNHLPYLLGSTIGIGFLVTKFVL